MLKKIMIVCGVVIIGLVAIGFALPGDYHAEASLEIPAPVSKVHATVNNLETWGRWGPWNAEDPSITTTISQASGVGAAQEWTSGAGKGRLVFTEVDPAKGIAYDLFFEGFPPAKAAFRYESAGPDRTLVTWTMDGSLEDPVSAGYMALLMGGAISSSFQTGLQNLADYVGTD